MSDDQPPPQETGESSSNQPNEEQQQPPPQQQEEQQQQQQEQATTESLAAAASTAVQSNITLSPNVSQGKVAASPQTNQQYNNKQQTQQQQQQQQPLDAKKQFEQIKQQCRLIIGAFRDEQNDITRALQNYKYILMHYKNAQTYTEECREYIMDRFLEDSCVALMKREHHHFQTDWNMADEINNCCKLLINIAVPLIKDDSHLAMQIIYYCLNTSNPFFRHFGHDWVKY